ncbi:phosphatidylserine synthase 2-like [Rhopilema esculentum]|uniref:phosphatidylserine synthase 2-like n=1 Tax=Rhopilema esculentum TaxID=499914 RepID=UPI0031DD00B3|eukprot:gene11339-21530_t
MENDIDMEKDSSKRNQVGCAKCSCSTRRASKQASYAMDPPFLDDLVQWNKDVVDDDDPSFFWRAHTISVLLLMILALCYVSLFEEEVIDPIYNAKRGLFACIVVFLAFGITQARDGPFVRPHPVFWRFILCCSVIYELMMIFILFQNNGDARSWMSFFDLSLGKPLPEVDYGSNCVFYDAENIDPFHNLKTKFDWFVPAHLFGWWAKAIILRDFWFANVLSILFEIYEYSLEHQLPNFHECWWDHWIMDAALCNGVGIYLGMKTCHFLEIKEYNWRSLWKIPTYTGKLKRAAEQFTPHHWDSFKWEATASLKRWLAIIGITIMFSLAELNCFYLKFVLWINPEHWLVVARLVLIGFAGTVGIREVYQYMDDSSCKRFGQQSWILAAIIITETLICLKFGWETIQMPPPSHIVLFWTLLLTGVAIYTIWRFLPSCIRRTEDEHFVKQQKVE